MAILTCFFHHNKNIEPMAFVSVLKKYLDEKDEKETSFNFTEGETEADPSTIRVDIETDLESVRENYSLLKHIPHSAAKKDNPFKPFLNNVSLFETDINISTPDQTTTLTALSIMRAVDAEIAETSVNEIWNVINGLSTQVFKLKRDVELMRTLFERSGASDFFHVTNEFISCFEQLGVSPDLTVIQRVH